LSPFIVIYSNALYVFLFESFLQNFLFFQAEVLFFLIIVNFCPDNENSVINVTVPIVLIELQVWNFLLADRVRWHFSK